MRALAIALVLSSTALGWEGESQLVASLRAEREAVTLQGPLTVGTLAIGTGAAAVGFAFLSPRQGFELGLTGNRNHDASMVLGCASAALFTGATVWLVERLWQRNRVEELLHGL